MRALWATIIAVITTATVQAAQPVAWRIVSVHDGDTIGALCPANECFLILVASNIEEGNIRERI